MSRFKQWTIDPSHSGLWRSDHFLRQMEQQLADIRLLSLDIFDTLLFRACAEPTEVFYIAASKAAAQSGILKPSISANEFRELRIRAEMEARKKYAASNAIYAEVTLEQIYEQIPASVCVRSRMLQLEMETEQEVCYLNPNVASLLYACKDKGISVALVSDMYVSSGQLAAILTSAGLDLKFIDVLLVSSEHGGSKVNGELFDQLFTHFPGLTGADIMHIGDNLTADIVGAASKQIRTLHYKVIPESFESPFHWDFIRHGNMLPELKSLRKLACESLPDGYAKLDDEERFFYRFGASVIGPFLHGLCEWVIDTCVRENRSEVHPLMREAYLLGPMLEHAAELRGVSLKVKPIYLSRQATYLASLEKFQEQQMDTLFAIPWAKVSDIFSMLDIEGESAPFEAYWDKSITACKLLQSESGITVAAKLGDFLLSQPIQSQIDQSIIRKRRQFVDYLLQLGSDVEKLVTVDIGFNGTMQKAMETALKLAGLPHQMLHLLAVGTGNIADLLLAGMDIRSYLGSCGDNNDLGKRIARTPAFLEELMMGEFGSTLRYESDQAGIVKPITSTLLVQSAQELSLKKACHEGCFAFQQYYGYLRDFKPNLLRRLHEDPREWSKVLHRVIDMPTPEEARLLGMLTHQENFCGVQVSPICNSIDKRWFERGEEAFIDFCNYGPSTFNAFWPQGMVTLQSPHYLYKFYLRQQDHFGQEGLILEMMNRLKRDNIETIQVMGAGAIADKVLKSALFHGIKAESCLKLTSAQLTSASHTYLIAAFADILAIRNEIELAYKGSGIAPVIYDWFVHINQ